MGVLDDFMVNPNISLLEKTRIQAQVLVPVMQAMRAEIGRDKADALVRDALREWSKQLFAEIGESIEGSPGAQIRQDEYRARRGDRTGRHVRHASPRQGGSRVRHHQLPFRRILSRAWRT